MTATTGDQGGGPHRVVFAADDRRRARAADDRRQALAAEDRRQACVAWDGEHGSVSILIVGLTLALLMVAGLLYDGGQILTARREVFAVADNAARAGAQAIDVGALRSGEPVRLDPLEASAAAHGYLDRVGANGTVVIADDRVEVVVTRTVELQLLSAVGLRTRTVTGTGQARIVQGITGPGG